MKRINPNDNAGKKRIGSRFDPIEVSDEEDSFDWSMIPDIREFQMEKSPEIGVINEQLEDESEETTVDEGSDELIERRNAIPERGILTDYLDPIVVMMNSIVNNSLNLSAMNEDVYAISKYDDCWPVFDRVTSLTLPNNMTSLNKTFRLAMPRLEYVKAGKFLRFIEEDAFNGMRTLKTFDTYNSEVIEEIGDYAFKGCTKLSNFYFPSTVTGIGDCAFMGCGITRMSLISRDCKIGVSAFEDCTRLKNIYFTKEVKLDLGPCVFRGCVSLKSVNMDRSICHEIPYQCFDGCTNMDVARMPRGVESLGESAFERCNVELLVFSGGLKSIHEYTFRDAHIGALQLGNDVKRLGEGAFLGCVVEGRRRWAPRDFDEEETVMETEESEDSFGEFAIPYSTEFIGDRALETPSLPNIDLTKYSLSKLGNDAIYCTNLVNISLPDRPFSRHFYNYVNPMGNVTQITTLRLPNSLTSINGESINGFADESERMEYYADNGVVKTASLNGLKTRQISMVDVKDIMPYACSGDTTLVKIEIPTTVTRIYNNAFVSLPNLQYVTMPERFRTKFPDIFPRLQRSVDIYLIN